MKVVLNGEEADVANGTTVENLVEHLGLAARRIAVELNRDVLERARWSDTAVKESDSIEIVQFVGGG